MRDTSKRLEKTREKITDALFSLLENNSYEEITIREIAYEADLTRNTVYRHFNNKDEMLRYSFEKYIGLLSDHISSHDPQDYRELCLLYFAFWEEHIDYLLMLRRADILYKFGREFESLVHLMAGRIKHSDNMDDAKYQKYLQKYRYHFAYRTSGFWKVTEIWCNEDPRPSPQKMADIMSDIAGNR